MVFWAGPETHLTVIESVSGTLACDPDVCHRMGIRIDDQTLTIEVKQDGVGRWRGTVGEVPWIGVLNGTSVDLQVAGCHFSLQRYGARSPTTASGAGIAAAPMPGVVVALPVALGDQVKAGDLVNVVALQVGGKGGGRPDLAQAGGTDATHLDSALGGVAEWVRQALG